MDRRIVYPQTVPQDIDILTPQRSTMIALGMLMEGIFGASTVATGFGCTVSGLTVTVGQGGLTSYTIVDSTAFGSLAVNGNSLLKMGISLGAVSFTIPAPTVGTTVESIIQAQYAETDGTPIVIPYYNASNPTSPYSGPGNTGVALNTVRSQTVSLECINGATSPTSGWTPLYTVFATNSGGTTTLNVAQHPSAPFIPNPLQALQPGFSRMQTFPVSATWTVPQGVQLAKLRMWGGGGGGGGGSSGNAGGGGAGGYFEGVVSLTPQQSIVVTIGGGGAAGTAGASGAAGGSSSFGSYVTCGSGGGGLTNNVGGSGGSGGAVTIGTGVVGPSNLSINGVGGQSGGSYGALGAAAFAGCPSYAVGVLVNASFGGGGGGSSGTFPGGSGGPGYAILEY